MNSFITLSWCVSWIDAKTVHTETYIYTHALPSRQNRENEREGQQQHTITEYVRNDSSTGWDWKKKQTEANQISFVSVSFTSLKCCCCGSCCFRFLSFPFRLCKCLSCSSLLLRNYSNFNLNGGKAHEFKSLNSNLSKVLFSSTAFFFLRIYFDEGWGKTEN